MAIRYSDDAKARVLEALTALGGDAAVPDAIAQKTGYSPSYVYRVLVALREANAVHAAAWVKANKRGWMQAWRAGEGTDAPKPTLALRRTRNRANIETSPTAKRLTVLFKAGETGTSRSLAPRVFSCQRNTVGLLKLMHQAGWLRIVRWERQAKGVGLPVYGWRFEGDTRKDARPLRPMTVTEKRHKRREALIAQHGDVTGERIYSAMFRGKRATRIVADGATVYQRQRPMTRISLGSQSHG